MLSDKIEKTYYFEYETKITDGKHKGKKILLKIKKEKSNEYLQYGNKIKLKGTYKSPEVQRNNYGFDYEKYLKSKSLHGSLIVKKSQIKIEKDKGLNWILMRYP